ncbi:LCP family protein required for cell wall assembly [Sporosarcina luteola]|nr:LCP family protein required for cell wall assembly [Sporosarcina luteola]
MEDKRFTGQFADQSMQELRFTKEDRNKVFEQLHQLDEKAAPQKKTRSKLVPLIVSLLMASLCILLFTPSILQGNVTTIQSETALHDENGVGSQKNDHDFTVLFTVKDDTDRVPINLLLSYHQDKKMVKVLSIPRDTYVPIIDQNGVTTFDKMIFAYVKGTGGAESVRTTVSNLFDLPIDYYTVMDLETFSTMIDSVSGIEYDLREDIRVRAISRAAFEFKKGTNHLNGEEVLSLLMDATTVGKSLGDEDLINILRKINEKLPPTQLNQFITKTEGNILRELLVESNVELPSIQLVSLKDGMKDNMIDEQYYITFEKDYLYAASKMLTISN